MPETEGPDEPFAIANGKYIFRTASDGCSVAIDRYGKRWVKIQNGSNAVHELMAYCLELRAELVAANDVISEDVVADGAELTAPQVIARLESEVTRLKGDLERIEGTEGTVIGMDPAGFAALYEKLGTPTKASWAKSLDATQEFVDQTQVRSVKYGQLAHIANCACDEFNAVKDPRCHPGGGFPSGRVESLAGPESVVGGVDHATAPDMTSIVEIVDGAVKALVDLSRDAEKIWTKAAQTLGEECAKVVEDVVEAHGRIAGELESGGPGPTTMEGPVRCVRCDGIVQMRYSIEAVKGVPACVVCGHVSDEPTECGSCGATALQGMVELGPPNTKYKMCGKCGWDNLRRMRAESMEIVVLGSPSGVDGHLPPGAFVALHESGMGRGEPRILFGCAFIISCTPGSYLKAHVYLNGQEDLKAVWRRSPGDYSESETAEIKAALDVAASPTDTQILPAAPAASESSGSKQCLSCMAVAVPKDGRCPVCSRLPMTEPYRS